MMVSVGVGVGVGVWVCMGVWVCVCVGVCVGVCDSQSSCNVILYFTISSVTFVTVNIATLAYPCVVCVTTEEIRSIFVHYGPLTVDWPHKLHTKACIPPKGTVIWFFPAKL